VVVSCILIVRLDTTLLEPFSQFSTQTVSLSFAIPIDDKLAVNVGRCVACCTGWAKNVGRTHDHNYVTSEPVFKNRALSLAISA